MKLLTAIFCLFLGLQSLKAESLSSAEIRKSRGYKYPMSNFELQENSIEQWSVNSFKTMSRIKQIKYYIINGNLNLAKVLLKEATLSVDFSKAIQFRYLAIIYFIEGNYKLALNLLNSPEMRDFSAQPKVCFMRVLSQLFLEQLEKAKISWARCREVTISKSKTDLLWMQIIVDLKTKKDKTVIENLFKDIAIDNVDDRFLRIYLKLALYLNQQKKIIPRFQYFGLEPLQDPTLRELIGLNYYRDGNLVKAYQLLEDLPTANSEVFKGNIYLYQKKYEQAYAQFKLAINRKNNSQNALDRLLPLAWKLNLWNDGLQYVQRSKFKKREEVEQLTLMAAFLTMSQRHDSAKKYLDQIITLTKKGQPVEVSQLMVLNKLKTKDFYDIETFADNGCAKRDAINCWLLYNLNFWDNFGEILSQEKIIQKDVKDLTDYYTQQKIDEPIKDNIYIKQKDIEELDNNLIDLVPEE